MRRIVRVVTLLLAAFFFLLTVIVISYQITMSQTGSKSRLLPFAYAVIKNPAFFFVHLPMLLPKTSSLPPDSLIFFDHLAVENMRIINKERISQGLMPLAIHPGLAELARQRAAGIIFQRDQKDLQEIIDDYMPGHPPFFSENSWLISLDLEMFRQGYITYDLAIYDLAALAYKGLMEGPGSRANILSPRYTHVGVAFAGSPVRGDDPLHDLYCIAVIQIFLTITQPPSGSVPLQL